MLTVNPPAFVCLEIIKLLFVHIFDCLSSADVLPKILMAKSQNQSKRIQRKRIRGAGSWRMGERKENMFLRTAEICVFAD